MPIGRVNFDKFLGWISDVVRSPSRRSVGNILKESRLRKRCSSGFHHDGAEDFFRPYSSGNRSNILCNLFPQVRKDLVM